MERNIELDLKKTLTLISADWDMQNNRSDWATRFIYEVDSLEACLAEIRRTGVDQDYALHRWYNFMTSVRCEDLFCEFGAVHESDEYNHDADIYIYGIPFDVKLTVYPARLAGRPYNLAERAGKNEMIRWFYRNQSQQSRKQLCNRLYVVCDAPTPKETMALKSNFDLMRKRISAYMSYIREHGINEVMIEDQGKMYRLKSDIIYLRT